MFQPAFIQSAVLVCRLQSHLCRRYGVIDGRLYHDALRVRHRGFKGNIVSDLGDVGIGKEIGKKQEKRRLVNICTNFMRDRNINARSLRSRESASDNMRPCRIKRGFLLSRIGLVRCGFKVKSDNLRIAQVITNALDRSHALVVCFHNVTPTNLQGCDDAVLTGSITETRLAISSMKFIIPNG